MFDFIISSAAQYGNVIRGRLSGNRGALTEEQIEEFDLPTRPTKREGNRHAQKFEGDSVELDALPASELRSMVREVIERHISEHDLDILRTAEGSERELLEAWAARAEAEQ